MHHENSYFYHLLNYHKNTKYLSLEQMNTLIHYMNNHYYCHEHRNYQFLKKKKHKKFKEKEPPPPLAAVAAQPELSQTDLNSKYFIWQKQHEIKTTLFATEAEKENITEEMIVDKKVEKKKVDIQTKVENLQDLINITNDHEYNDDCEYNIDLKSLHNIKKELIEMNSMIGMTDLKKSIVEQILYFIQQFDVNSNDDYKHTIIYGPPGTGKTEIAKIIGKIFCNLGVLKNNIFKKVTRNDLVAGYLGQTALKTKKVMDECLGGCLFIDEVYSLGSTDHNDSFSKECIDTICEALSDHKNDLMVIIAGYEDEVNYLLFNVNKGLNSRFIWRYKIHNYTANELFLIFKKKVHENNWFFFENHSSPTYASTTAMMTEETKIMNWFSKKYLYFKYFGRDVELLFTYTKICHSKRVYGKPQLEKKKITLKDIENGFDIFMNNNDHQNNTSSVKYEMYV